MAKKLSQFLPGNKSYLMDGPQSKVLQSNLTLQSICSLFSSVWPCISNMSHAIHKV